MNDKNVLYNLAARLHDFQKDNDWYSYSGAKEIGATNENMIAALYDGLGGSPLGMTNVIFSLHLLAENRLGTEEQIDTARSLMQDIAACLDEYRNGSFSIYQVKPGVEMQDYCFEPYDRLHKAGLRVDYDNYDHVYSGFCDGRTEPEDLFVRFNTDLPGDYRGRSVSVSDVLVLREHGGQHAYYVDRFGFKQVPEFLVGELTEKLMIISPGAISMVDNYLKNAEMSAEQNYTMLDGLINNEAPKKADLTDGQTYEEILELAPETISDKKASISDKLKQAKGSIPPSGHEVKCEPER